MENNIVRLRLAIGEKLAVPHDFLPGIHQHCEIFLSRKRNHNANQYIKHIESAMGLNKVLVLLVASGTGEMC